MRNSKSELENIPGIGKSLAKDLNKLDIFTVSDLKGKDPEELYKRLESIEGSHIDRCVLYTFRCAVYYANNTNYDPEKLKWWNWKDKSEKKIS